MSFWLAQARNGQHSAHIQRFDPRFWTVDFPRPMMASVVTTAPDALRVECEFLHDGALAGLIWDSVDRLDHPLLAYDTDCDYSRTTLRFRWRSSGIVPLDQPHGPTLTIEGRDANGQARSWYVRLWNYASGTPEDAEITLPLSDLRGGWTATGEAGDPVHPAAIDRLFISLAPPGYVPDGTTQLAPRAEGWAELSAIRCDGHRAMLAIGDVVVPPHDISMCTAYDDAYNQTPARLLRAIRHLGYRGDVIHYVGMSHYYRLHPVDGRLEVKASAELAGPAAAWHRDYFTRAVADRLSPVASLSYELLDQDCPEDWKQRFADGAPALTGWVPPSTLLSPANNKALTFLRNTMAAFVELLQQAGASPQFQIGEPWWWTTPDGRIALYDAAARAMFSDNAPVIEDLRLPLSPAQIDVLDAAGARLNISTASIISKIEQVAGDAASPRLLAFTPTILDPAMAELHRANLPQQWAAPRFDRLQLEDYDWLTAGTDARRRQAFDFVEAKLAYPRDQIDYFAGFVLDSADADALWPRIDAALDEAAAHGITRRFVWALPQVARDGYTRLPPSQEDAMQAFDDVLYPLAPGRDVAVSPEFSTTVMTTASGHERRAALWADARLHYDVGPGIRSEAELGTLLAFFRARRGPARGFRLADPFDCSSNAMTGPPGANDQLLGIGDGTQSVFDLVKSYGQGAEAQQRIITRPRLATLRVSVGGAETTAWQWQDGGRIVLTEAPPAGAEVRAGYLFDVPVRFAQDRLDITGVNFAAGEAPSVPLIEVREER